MDWNHVRAFLETVERGSLTGAARALNLTQPTVGRQIAALEERLGVLLFDRIGKSLSLTPGGLDLLEHARVMGKAIADLQIAATGQATSIVMPASSARSCSRRSRCSSWEGGSDTNRASAARR